MLIRNDFAGVSLYFEFFHEYVANYKILPFFLKKVFNSIKKFLLTSIFIFRHNVLKRDLVLSAEDFVIKREGVGKIKSDTFLVNNSGLLYVKRKIYSDEIYKIYKEYYLKYYENKSNLSFPKAVFDDDEKTIITDFIRAPKLLNLFYDKKHGFDGIINIYYKICDQLDIMYDKESFGPVHGDFSVVNILVDGDDYFLIDYPDSFLYERKYDKYLLIRSIFKFFGIGIEFNSLSKYIKLNEEKFNEYESMYQYRRGLK